MEAPNAKTYDSYTLLQLIHTLDAQQIPITCKLNKKAITAMIEQQKIDIPQQAPGTYEYVLGYDDATKMLDIKTTWILSDGQQMQGTFSFSQGDIIHASNGYMFNIYMMELETYENEETINIFLEYEDKDIDETQCLLATTFAEIVQQKNITIVKNLSRNV